VRTFSSKWNVLSIDHISRPKLLVVGLNCHLMRIDESLCRNSHVHVPGLVILRTRRQKSFPFHHVEQGDSFNSEKELTNGNRTFTQR
jgi:hypothetical protein